MVPETVDTLLKKIKFGNKQERFIALLAMKNSMASLEEVAPYLYPIMNNKSIDDPTESISSAVALAHLGDHSEEVRDMLIDSLYNLSQNLPKLGIHSVDPDTPGVMMIVGARVAFQREIAQALAVFKNDEIVSEGLTQIIQKLPVSDYDQLDEWMPKSVTNACLIAIGSVGSVQGKEFLEYWKEKGNFFAAAAFDLFGSDYDKISEKAKQLEQAAEDLKKEKQRVEAIHQSINRNVKNSTKSKCYIATAVYGNGNAPEVLLLRQFRDRFLLSSMMGRLFVTVYYFISPRMIKYLNGSIRKKIIKALVINPALYFAKKRLGLNSS
jgi:hypothetical protein